VLVGFGSDCGTVDAVINGREGIREPFVWNGAWARRANDNAVRLYIICLYAPPRAPRLLAVPDKGRPDDGIFRRYTRASGGSEKKTDRDHVVGRRRRHRLAE